MFRCSISHFTWHVTSINFKFKMFSSCFLTYQPYFLCCKKRNIPKVTHSWSLAMMEFECWFYVSFQHTIIFKRNWTFDLPLPIFFFLQPLLSQNVGIIMKAPFLSMTHILYIRKTLVILPAKYCSNTSLLSIFISTSNISCYHLQLKLNYFFHSLSLPKESEGSFGNINQAILPQYLKPFSDFLFHLELPQSPLFYFLPHSLQILTYFLIPFPLQGLHVPLSAWSALALSSGHFTDTDTLNISLPVHSCSSWVLHLPPFIVSYISQDMS